MKNLMHIFVLLLCAAGWVYAQEDQSTVSALYSFLTIEKGVLYHNDGVGNKSAQGDLTKCYLRGMDISKNKKNFGVLAEVKKGTHEHGLYLCLIKLPSDYNNLIRKKGGGALFTDKNNMSEIALKDVTGIRVDDEGKIYFKSNSGECQAKSSKVSLHL